MGLFADFNPFARVAANQYGMVGHNINRGSLIAFHYPYSLATPPNPIHDPYPLVIVTDIWPIFLRGVNLHYLTFPYIKKILTGNCGSPAYSYYKVRPDRYVASAFRMYYRRGMSQIKKMDCDFLVKLLMGIRSWSPTELEHVRQEVRRQIREQLQMQAEQLNQLDQERLKFTRSQQEQVRRKAMEMQQAMTGGAERGLIYPQSTTGPKAANFPLPTTGEFSTGDLE